MAVKGNTVGDDVGINTSDWDPPKVDHIIFHLILLWQPHDATLRDKANYLTITNHEV